MGCGPAVSGTPSLVVMETVWLCIVSLPGLILICLGTGASLGDLALTKDEERRGCTTSSCSRATWGSTQGHMPLQISARVFWSCSVTC